MGSPHCTGQAPPCGLPPPRPHSGPPRSVHPPDHSVFQILASSPRVPVLATLAPTLAHVDLRTSPPSGMVCSQLPARLAEHHLREAFLGFSVQNVNTALCTPFPALPHGTDPHLIYRIPPYSARLSPHFPNVNRMRTRASWVCLLLCIPRT